MAVLPTRKPHTYALWAMRIYATMAQSMHNDVRSKPFRNQKKELSPKRGFPINDKAEQFYAVHAEILAAPASRRLGRAGLEAPPLRGQKMLSF